MIMYWYTPKRAFLLIFFSIALLLAYFSASNANPITLRQATDEVVDVGKSGKTAAVRGAQPWMVALVDATEPNAYRGQFCGGSLIAETWVLTAAHCVAGITAADVDVVIGRYTLSSNEGERIYVADIISHFAFNPLTANSDIALIKLAQPATAGEPIQLIGTATERLDDPDMPARVTGWGLVPENENPFPDDLHGVDLPIAAQSVCRDTYGEFSVRGRMICAGVPEGGLDACRGDSGGALTVKNGDDWVQVGIVSWGSACGLPNSYGVYSRITEFEGWLARQLGADFQPAQVVQLAESKRIDVANLNMPRMYELDEIVVEDDGKTSAIYYSRFNYIIATTHEASFTSLADLDLDGGSVVTINGVETYIGRYSSSSTSFTQAIMIIDEQLIVIQSSVRPPVLILYLDTMFR